MLVHAFVIILSIGVSTPPQKRHPLFPPKPSPLNSANCSSPPFQTIPPYMLLFHEPSPLP